MKQIHSRKIASKNSYPKKEQVLIIEITDNIQKQDYVFAITEITKLENIIFVSRISKDRFCIFLSNFELVEKARNQPKQIVINNIPIKVRRYFNPDKRIIISNVYPTIPHDVIEKELINIGAIPQPVEWHTSEQTSRKKD